MTNLILMGLLSLVTSVLVIRVRKTALLLLCSITITLFIFELTAFIGERLLHEPKRKYVSSIKYYITDPFLPYWHKPEISATMTKFKGEETMYKDVPYSFDQKGRRNSLSASLKSAKHALFFGGSFTFGDGVVDNQTLPSHFQRASEHEYTSYNYGVSGFGTGEMFVLLDRDTLFDDIDSDNGIAVYSFIGPHLERSTIYNINYFIKFPIPNPLFFCDECEDRLDGPFQFRDIAKEKTLFYLYGRLWHHSPLFRFVAKRIDPKYISEEHATRIVARLIIESRNKYKKRFNGDFYVLLWPRLIYKMEDDNKELLKQLLSKESIKVIDVPPMENSASATLHPMDTHPNPDEYKWVAGYLYDAVVRGR